MGSKLGERNILPCQFSEQGWDGGVKFFHLHEHGAIFRSNVTDAFDAAQSRHIEPFRRAACRKLHHVFRTGRGDQFARRAQGDFSAMIHDGHAVAKPLGFVHVMGGEQNRPAGFFKFLD